MSAPTTQEGAGSDLPVGETLSVPERVIVAPARGVFHRLDDHVPMNAGDLVNRGDAIGIVQSLRVSIPIQSPFEGLLVAILASEGQRLRPGQPVAWLRVR
jgi:biotin carboxyl carrier protein